MFRVVYAEIIANVAFNRNNLMVKTQQLNGVDLGYHHSNAQGATRIMEVISEEMHATLLKSLKGGNYPVSIVLNGSTSTDVVHFLVVLFQTLENNRPIVYFYRLIELGVQ